MMNPHLSGSDRNLDGVITRIQFGVHVTLELCAFCMDLVLVPAPVLLSISCEGDSTFMLSNTGAGTNTKSIQKAFKLWEV
jgi:hypothetical protein